MRSEGSVKHKIKQVAFRYLKKHMERMLSVKSTNCAYNVCVDRSPDQDVYCCAHPEVAPEHGVMLECSPYRERAVDCPYYELRHQKDAVKLAFQDDMRTLALPELAYRYPDMAALLWVVGGDTPDADVFDDIAPEEPPAQSLPERVPLDAPPDQAPLGFWHTLARTCLGSWWQR